MSCKRASKPNRPESFWKGRGTDMRPLGAIWRPWWALPTWRRGPWRAKCRTACSQLTWEDTFSRLLAESPQLAAAQAGVARAQAALSRECAGRVPNIDLQAAVQYDNATKDTFATVQVGVPMPIFNRNQGNIRRAQAELMAAQNEVQRVQLELQQRLAAVFEQYTNARYQVEKYSRDILPNAEASLKLTNAGYRQGEYNYLFLLTAQRTYFQTNLDLPGRPSRTPRGCDGHRGEPAKRQSPGR